MNISTESNGANDAAAIDIDRVRSKFVTIQAELGRVFRERGGAIECMTLAALSQSHALLVGPPGTAKSALFFGFLGAFKNARKFQTLVTKFGTEDEYFGPVKLSALKQDQWERNLDGRLAGVECAFLDEVFKGSDAVLNTLLSAMNERLYKGKAIPLRMLVGASNELPEEEVLAAVYDRFLLRDVVGYVQNDATWMQLVASPPSYVPSVEITLAEWEAACADVAKVTMPERVVIEMLKIRTALVKAGIVVSDRRWIALTRVMRAAAWLDGETEVGTDHLAVLRFGLWQKPDDRKSVEAALATVDKSVVAQAVKRIDEALSLYAARPTDPTLWSDAAPKLAADLTNAAKDVHKLLDRGVSKRALARIQPKLEDLKAAHGALKKDLRERLGL